MSDEMRPDREALRLAVASAIGASYGIVGPKAWAAADNVLALIPAPHPQGVPVPADYTRIVADLLRQRDALRARIEAFCDEAERKSVAVPTYRITPAAVRALLAAAPAPTEAGDE